MSDERDKYEKVLAYTEVALARSQRRSDQLSLAVSVLAGGVVAVSFAVLPITAVAVWARLLLGLLSFAALMACGLVLMVADPTMRTGATDPTAVAQQALNPMTDPLQTVTSHLIISLGEHSRHTRRLKTQMYRAAAALLLAATTATVALVLTLVKVDS